ncbi:MAG: hypothetical protein KatS3mg131_1895 [Candidatus Tectimicrobiota bacterium]|nr:MAG: hypothetical protein KatS3mg131_1895 [Candidatus Tectomicrobia bacterium]
MATETCCTVEFRVQTSRKCQVVDITPLVEEAVKKSGVTDGLCAVYVAHTTAAVTVNENADPNIGEDILEALERLIPEGIWRHDQVDDNAAAHIKAALLGPSETIPVRNGKLQLGTWQAVLLFEFDGPRDRQLLVTLR